MYRTAYQRGMLTIFFSCGSKPLNIWDTVTKDGYISRFLDQDIKSMVLEIGGTNVSTTYMICPKGNAVLGITMPFLVMIVKNLKKYFSFEVTILDDTGTRRRFRVSNFQSNTQIMPLCTAMPISLSDGWNQIQFNLAEFTRRAYKKQFVEVQKIKINANIRLRRVYFAERLLPEDQLPPEYKLFFPLDKAAKLKKDALEQNKENVKPSSSAQAEILEPKTSKIELRKEPEQPVRAPSQAAVDVPPPGVPVPEVRIETIAETPATETVASEVETGETVAVEEATIEEGLQAAPTEEVSAEKAPAGEVPTTEEAPADESFAAEEVPAGEASVGKETPAEVPVDESAVPTEEIPAPAEEATAVADEAPAPTEEVPPPAE